ncbi:hypothetical protein XAR_1867 [Xanthomonas citri pv. glycines str. 8ra]|nr:hypothetical protein XAR_1867 [Xanthomonas citri pv. glycines str. 8ra]
MLARVLDDRRRGALPERDLGAGGIEHADRLVRQLAAADVAVRQAHRLGDRLVHHPDAEVLLHQRHHAAQHRRGQRLARLLDLDHLEAPRQRRVLLEVLLVFAPGGGRDGAQLAARQRRLEQVRRVVLAGGAAGADHRVRLVDEQDDRMRALLDLVDDVLQPVLELALDAGAGLQQAHIQHMQFHPLQYVRHVLLGDAPGQPLDDRGLADAGFAGEDRIVLAPPHQDVDHLPDLAVAADHRVDLRIAGALGEVGGELVQRRGLAQAALAVRRAGEAIDRVAAGVGLAGIGETQALPGFLRAFGEAGEVVLERVELDLHELLGTAVGQLRQVRLGQHRQQQMTAADARGFRIQRGDQPGVLEQRGQVLGKYRRARIAGLEAADLLAEIAFQRLRRNAAAARDQHEIALRLLQQRQEQMLQVDFVVAARHAQIGRALGRLPAGVVEFADQGLEIDAHAKTGRSMLAVS